MFSVLTFQQSYDCQQKTGCKVSQDSSLHAYFHTVRADWKQMAVTTIRGKNYYKSSNKYLVCKLCSNNVKCVLYKAPEAVVYKGPLKMDVKMVASMETPTLCHKPQPSR